MTSMLIGGAKILATLALSCFLAVQSTSAGCSPSSSRCLAPGLAASVVTHLDQASSVVGLTSLLASSVRSATHDAAIDRIEAVALRPFIRTALAYVLAAPACGVQEATPRERSKAALAGRLAGLAAVVLSVDFDQIESASGLEPGLKSEARGKRKRESDTRTTAQDLDSDAEAEPDSDSEPSRPRPKRRSSSQSVILGDDQVVVPEDEYLSEGLVCIGGTAIVRGEVRDQIVVIGGVLHLSGSVRGDIVGVGSRMYIEDGARVSGSVTNIAGSVERARDVKIDGAFTSIGFPNLGQFATGRGMLRYVLFLVFWIVIFSTALQFLAVLVVAAVAPDRIEGALAAPRRSWVLAFFVGAIVHIFATLFTLILCALLPLGVAFWIAVHVALWMGRAAIYLHIGRGIGRTLFGKELSYFGSILTGFALFAILGLVPCLGLVFNWMVSSTGLGLMLLTRFGRRRTAPIIPLVPSPSGAPPAGP